MDSTYFVLPRQAGDHRLGGKWRRTEPTRVGSGRLGGPSKPTSAAAIVDSHCRSPHQSSLKIDGSTTTVRSTSHSATPMQAPEHRALTWIHPADGVLRGKRNAMVISGLGRAPPMSISRTICSDQRSPMRRVPIATGV